MSDIANDSQQQSKSKTGLWIALTVAAVLLAVIFEPTGIIRGRLFGEDFFNGRPASYWKDRLLSGPAKRSSARSSLESGGQEAVTVLVTLLEDPESNEIRWTAAEILGKLGPDATASSDALLQALKDRDPYVQSVAAEMIPKVGTPAEKAVPALAELLDGKHAAVVARAISVYKAQAAPAIPQLVEVLTDTSRTADARWNAARTIGKIGPPAVETVPILIEMTKDKEATVRGNAAEAIGDIGPKAAAGVPALIDVLDDPAHRVRHHAVRSLGYIGKGAKESVPHIRPLLDDPEPSVKEEAVKALAILAPDEGDPPDDTNPVQLNAPE